MRLLPRVSPNNVEAFLPVRYSEYQDPGLEDLDRNSVLPTYPRFEGPPEAWNERANLGRREKKYIGVEQRKLFPLL